MLYSLDTDRIVKRLTKKTSTPIFKTHAVRVHNKCFLNAIDVNDDMVHAEFQRVATDLQSGTEQRNTF
jgi:hypothetical protein